MAAPCLLSDCRCGVDVYGDVAGLPAVMGVAILDGFSVDCAPRGHHRTRLRYAGGGRYRVLTAFDRDVVGKTAVAEPQFCYAPYHHFYPGVAWMNLPKVHKIFSREK